MKQYNVLKDFPGSQDGVTTTNFEKGTTVGLSDSLAEVALKEKWVEPAKEEKKPASKGKAGEKDK